MLVRVDASLDEEIREAHAGAKRELIDYINSKTDAGMDHSTLTLGFARRATEYKRGLPSCLGFEAA
jgi:starch phosphorylase